MVGLVEVVADRVCEYCGYEGGLLVELRQGDFAPEEFSICGQCMLLALMRYEADLEEGRLCLVYSAAAS